MDGEWLEKIKQIVRRDDWMLYLVGSDIRQLVARVEWLEAEVERLKADLEEAEQSHYIADLESRIAVVKECLSGIEWHGLTISVNHQSNVDRAILALRDIVPTAKDNATHRDGGDAKETT